jgi:hypothetical protein
MIRVVASLYGRSLVLFYYFSASKLWLDKRGSLWWEKAYKRGEYSNLILVISHNHGKTIFVMKLRWISS